MSAKSGKTLEDEVILKYNDVSLRKPDLDILNGPNFLNDQVIEFYFKSLSSSLSSDEILLVSPSVAFLIKAYPDENDIKESIKHLNLPQKKIIILPINDNSNVNLAEGGAHWSLLVFERNANVFVHHDSSRLNMNSHDAKKVYKFLRRYVWLSESSNARYIEYSNTPKQDNSYDCGVFVMAFARAICDWYSESAAKNYTDDDYEKLWFAEIEKITPSVASSLRREVLEFIRSKMMKTNNRAIL